MSIEHTKKKMGRRRINEAIDPVLSYAQIEGFPDHEIQERVDKAFDALFIEVFRDRLN